VSIILLWKLKDAYLLKVEMIALIVFGAPFYFLWAIFFVVGADYSDTFYCIFEFACLLCTLGIPGIGSFIYSKNLQLAKTKSIITFDKMESKNLEAPVEIIDTPKNVDMVSEFNYCMENEVLAAEFERYAAESWCLENLLFWQQVKRYKQNPEDQLFEEALKIVARFIQLGAPCEINIDDPARENIFEKIQNMNVSRTLFDQTESEVLRMLINSVFPLWLVHRMKRKRKHQHRQQKNQKPEQEQQQQQEEPVDNSPSTNMLMDEINSNV